MFTITITVIKKQSYQQYCFDTKEYNGVLKLIYNIVGLFLITDLCNMYEKHQ